MKIYLYNPESGAPIKNWSDGSNFWKLGIGEVAGFPEATAKMLKATYGFLQEVSQEDFEAQLAKFEKEEPTKIKVDSDGALVPKTDEDIEGEKEAIEIKKKMIKKTKEK